MYIECFVLLCVYGIYNILRILPNNYVLWACIQVCNIYIFHIYTYMIVALYTTYQQCIICILFCNFLLRVCIYYLFIPNYICKILGAKSAEAAKALDTAMDSGRFKSKKDAIDSLPMEQRAIVQQQQDRGEALGTFICIYI